MRSVRSIWHEAAHSNRRNPNPRAAAFCLVLTFSTSAEVRAQECIATSSENSEHPASGSAVEMPFVSSEDLWVAQGWFVDPEPNVPCCPCSTPSCSCLTHCHEPAWDFNWHRADDDWGMPVVATRSGYVCFAEATKHGYGRVIILRYGGSSEEDCALDGQYGRYAHLSAFAVRVGEYVFQGQVIGYLGGSKGTASGEPVEKGWSPHLHYSTLQTLDVENTRAGNTISTPYDYSPMHYVCNQTERDAAPGKRSFQGCTTSASGPPHYFSANEQLWQRALDRVGTHPSDPRAGPGAGILQLRWLSNFVKWSPCTDSTLCAAQSVFWRGADLGGNIVQPASISKTGVALNYYYTRVANTPFGNITAIYDALGGAEEVRLLRSGFQDYFLNVCDGIGPRLSELPGSEQASACISVVTSGGSSGGLATNGQCPSILALGLGPPITDEYPISTGGTRQDFVRGYLYWDGHVVSASPYSRGAAPGWWEWLASDGARRFGWNQRDSYTMVRAYGRALGASTHLGEAVNAVHDWGGVTIQDFDDAPQPLCDTGDSRDSAIVLEAIDETGKGGADAHVLKCGFWATYKCLLQPSGLEGGGPRLLGSPIEDEHLEAIDDECNALSFLSADAVTKLYHTVTVQRFQRGCMWWRGYELSVGPFGDLITMPGQIHLHVNTAVDLSVASACVGLQVVPNPPGPSSCTDDCTPGDGRQCASGDRIRWACSRGFDSDVCYDWLESTCPAGRTCSCGGGTCDCIIGSSSSSSSSGGGSCTNPCTPASLRCAGPDSFNSCISINGCGTWQQTPQACPVGQVCQGPDGNAACVVASSSSSSSGGGSSGSSSSSGSCVSTCAPGDQPACLAYHQAQQSCARGGDGCYHWEDRACPDPGYCVQGFCVGPPSRPLLFGSPHSTYVELSWTDSDSELFYDLYRTIDPTSQMTTWPYVAGTAQNITATVDYSLTSCTTYTYAVRAANAYGVTYSDPLAIATLCTPDAGAPATSNASTSGSVSTSGATSSGSPSSSSSTSGPASPGGSSSAWPASSSVGTTGTMVVLTTAWNAGGVLPGTSVDALMCIGQPSGGLMSGNTYTIEFGLAPQVRAP